MRRALLLLLTCSLSLAGVAQGDPNASNLRDRKMAGAVAKEVPTASEVLAEAEATALREKKNVLVLFHASWCGWCRKMDTAMAEPAMKPLFEKSFVIRHLTVYESPNKKALENPGAEDLLKKYKGNDLGIPYFLVFDGKGSFLGDSQMKPGENVGCPAQDSEVAYFITLLKRTTKLSESELSAIAERFKKNKS